MTEESRVIALEQNVAAQMIAGQFPELAGRPVRPLAGKGTDNHIFRIGDDLCARFPKAAWAAGTATREAMALARFAASPLAVPEVYGLGAPTDEYPHPWSVLSWLPGEVMEDSALGDSVAAAGQLAEFFRFVRDVPVDGAFAFGPSNNGRGAPLAKRTARFEAALAHLPEIDSLWARRVWDAAIGADVARSPVWLHGDVHPGNVLIRQECLAAVIDWGLSGVGDGACDLLSAWAMFERTPREVFRKAVDASDADWQRGAGWALSMAVIYLPYAYQNGLRSDMSEKMVKRLKEEFP